METMRIKTYRIDQIQIHISPEQQTEPIDLDVQLKSRVNLPSDQKKKSVLFDLTLTVNAKNEEDFSIFVESSFVLGCQSIPEHYHEDFSEKCLKISAKELSDKIDCILTQMNYRPLNFYSNMSFE